MEEKRKHNVSIRLDWFFVTITKLFINIEKLNGNSKQKLAEL